MVVSVALERRSGISAKRWTDMGQKVVRTSRMSFVKKRMGGAVLGES